MTSLACERGSEETKCSQSEGRSAQSALKALKALVFGSFFPPGSRGQFMQVMSTHGVKNKKTGRAGEDQTSPELPDLQPTGPASCCNIRRGTMAWQECSLGFSSTHSKAKGWAQTQQPCSKAPKSGHGPSSTCSQKLPQHPARSNPAPSSQENPKG